ncbi:MAG: hypothetical protein WA790_00225 [Sulfitobacter sp.]
MKYCFLQWAIGCALIFLSALSGWSPFLVFLSGLIIGFAVVMSSVEIQDAKFKEGARD